MRIGPSKFYGNLLGKYDIRTVYIMSKDFEVKLDVREIKGEVGLYFSYGRFATFEEAEEQGRKLLDGIVKESAEEGIKRVYVWQYDEKGSIKETLIK